MSGGNPQNKAAVVGQWTSSIVDFLDDLPTSLIGYYLPCVLYGQNAARVHGGNGTSHCIKYYIYNFICACGLVAGPTRRAMRAAYNLPAEPACFGNGNMADCLTHTTPCVNCCALSQEAREIAARNPLAPIDAIPFSWGPIKSPSESPTKAPSQAEMTTEIPK